MYDLSTHVKAVTRVNFFFLSACCLAWALLPAYEDWWGGLMIGCAASLINARHLAWKVTRASANAAAHGTKRVNLGYLTRACIALLAVVLATRTYTFQLPAVVTGLIIAQLATLILGFFASRKLAQMEITDERGETN
ncbi:ATP synthase subunit I [Paenibacillus sp. HB172176]|uniref:ATP synthase subunit I n=1 Tax=Paenibacillus sp. HB172176 TaxID=2493690 RepID=UPI00143B9596|nr:ATP synthase subunit I [Paenibacillus sp. HB172176]